MSCPRSGPATPTRDKASSRDFVTAKSLALVRGSRPSAPLRAGSFENREKWGTLVRGRSWKFKSVGQECPTHTDSAGLVKDARKGIPNAHSIFVAWCATICQRPFFLTQTCRKQACTL